MGTRSSSFHSNWTDIPSVPHVKCRTLWGERR